MRPKITGMPDVRDIPPSDCHAVIFQHHGALAPGEAFELRNNHDPRALNYQFETQHPEEDTWEFLEEGPKAWRVSIGRPYGAAFPIGPCAGRLR
jgi:uncharacterized protein (DUF2249 family)